MATSITILGATGGTGRHLVEQGLAAGFDVTAVARDPARVPDRHERLRVLQGDVLDVASVEHAVRGADAVLSAIGPRSRKAPPVCGPGIANVLKAMGRTGVRRFIGVSAAPVAVDDAGDRLLYRLTFKRVIRAILADAYGDMARMEEEVRHSDLDWTVMRPPMLTNRSRTGRYRTARGRNIPGGYLISRADLAAEMLRTLDDPRTIRATVGIGY